MAYFDAPYRPADLTLNSDSINNDLVGFWALTDGSGTSAVDVSTGGNDGTLSTTNLWSVQAIGACFDGSTGSHISGTGVNLGGSSGTLSMWFKADSEQNNKYMLSLPYASAGSNGFNIAAITGGCRIDLATSAGFKQLSYTAQNVQDGGIYHIVATYDGSSIYLYVDGVQVATTTHTGTINQQADGEFNINRFGSYGRLSDGYYQNVRIFNAALTAAQVEQLYTRPWTGTNYDTEALWLSPPASPTLSSASEATSLMTDCVGWWPLTEGSGTTATDSVGSNNATQSGGVSWENSELGNVASFDGVDDIFDANAYTISSTSNMTMAGWVKYTSTVGSLCVLNICNDSGGNNAQYTRNIAISSSGNAACNVQSGTVIAQAVGSTVFTVGQWYFVAGIFEKVGTSYNVEIFVNGVSEATGFGTGSELTPYTKTCIGGGRRRNQAITAVEPCQLHNVRIFDAALTADQIRLLYERPWIGAEYNETAPLYPPVPSSLTPLDSSNSILVDQELWLPLTDGSGATAVDISGGGNDGTLDTTVSFGNGELGTNAEFDPAGLNDGITTTYSPNGLSAISLSAWVRNDGGSAGSGFAKILASDHSAGSGGFDWMIGKSGNASYALYIAGAGNVSIASTTLPALGEWWHAAATWETGGNIKLYINGVEVTYSRQDSYTGSLTTTNDVEIGDAPNATRPWNGGIQNVRLWSRALSASEVADIYYSPWLGSAYPSTGGGTPSYFVAAQFNRLGIGPRFRRL